MDTLGNYNGKILEIGQFELLLGEQGRNINVRKIEIKNILMIIDYD